MMGKVVRLHVKEYFLLSMLLVIGCMTQLPAVGEIQGRCGDAVVGEGEACDDGNEVNEDACTNECETARCGDSFVRTDLEVGDPFYEGCDDGNINDRDACTNVCAAARCGDGIWRRDLLFADDRGFERCDDGNLNESDGCTTACAPPRCGDGIRQDTEVCDDGNESNSDACLNTCTASACGDGFLRTGLEPNAEGYEECDGEVDCSDSCQLMFCGNGELEGTEVCDDGNEILTDACANCREARCGDGFVRADRVAGQPGYEACDDGNLQAGDECSVECLVDDHGNSIQYATRIIMPAELLKTYLGNIVMGRIHNFSDKDYFALTARDSGVYRFDVNAEAPGNPTCRIFNSGEHLTGYNEDRVEGDYGCSVDLYIEANTTAYLEVTTDNPFVYDYRIGIQTPCGNGIVDQGEECDPNSPNSNSFRCREDCRNRRMISLAGTTGCAIVDGGVKCWGSNAGLMLGDEFSSDLRCPKEGVDEYGNVGRFDVDISRFPTEVIPTSARVTDLSGGWNEAACALYGTNNTPYCWGRIYTQDNFIADFERNLFSQCQDDRANPPGNGGYWDYLDGGCLAVPTPYAWVEADRPAPTLNTLGMSVGAHNRCLVTSLNDTTRAFCSGKVYNGMSGAGPVCNQPQDNDVRCRRLQAFDLHPLVMPRTGTISYLTMGTETGCAIINGRVACWGRNDFGQAGTERQVRESGCLVDACEMRPQLIRSIGQVVSLSVGGDHVCSVTARGHVYCWGKNDRAQTGLESDRERCTRADVPCVRQPQRLDDVPLVADVAAGRAHTCALTRSGQVICWGDNTKGQLGSGSLGAIQPGGAPYSRAFITVGRLGTTLGITAGEYSNCSRSETGQIYCWGDNAQGQLGDGNCTAAVPSPIQVELR